MKKRPSFLRRLAPLILLAVLIPAAMWFAARGIGRRADDEALHLMEQSVQRAAVQCYALEGFYPAQLDYLCQHYGVVIDQKRYFVDYQYVASNLLPDIVVLPISE